MQEEYENAEWQVEVDGQPWDYGTFASAEQAQAAYKDWFCAKCDDSGEYEFGDTAEQEIDIMLMIEGDKLLERKTVTVHYECNQIDMIKEHGTWGAIC